jgi:hypothetical protein
LLVGGDQPGLPLPATAYGAALVLGGVGLVSLLLKLAVEQLIGGVKESRSSLE